MSQKQDNLIVVLDAGSMWTRVLVADLNEGALRYRGHGIVESAGMRKGLIAELGPASKAVKAASEIAEDVARANIDECIVGVGGAHVHGVNTTGGISLGQRLREITREDVKAAVERARAVSLPPDREILHLLPSQFVLDEQPGIYDPVGMVGNKLEVLLHIATCSGSALQSTVTCANRAGLEVTETVLEAVAAAEGTLSADERELGVCLLDIGAHSTEMIVFFEGAVVHSDSLRIGGAHFTNDLAIGLQIPISVAEKVKREHGHTVVTSVSQSAEFELPSPVEDAPPISMRYRVVAEILEPRARELFHHVRNSLRDAGVLEALGAGCVLTGGGSILPGMLDNAESLLRVSARIAAPVPLSKMPQDLVHPENATLIGMLLYAHRTRISREAENNSLRAKLRALFASSI